MFKLLSTANPKIQKGTDKGYLSFILHLAPVRNYEHRAAHALNSMAHVSTEVSRTIHTRPPDC